MTQQAPGQPLVSGQNLVAVAHTGRPDIAETIQAALRHFVPRHIGLSALPEEADDYGLPEVEPGDPVAMVLALGGDGTMLRAAEFAKTVNAPVLGINHGRVGFLAEISADEIGAAWCALTDGNFRVDSRMTIDVERTAPDGSWEAAGWALNELSVEKSVSEKVLDVVVCLDGTTLSAFGCDGVLVSTPTGSTAYAFSAGGPIIWPDLDVLLVLPNNAHALFARPVVLGPDTEIIVAIGADGQQATVACDGLRTFRIPAGAKVRVRRGHNRVHLVRLHSRPFTERLVEKFNLPTASWRSTR